MTIDCYLWGWKRNSGRAGWGSGDELIIFHCDGDVKSIAVPVLGSCWTSVYSVWFTGQICNESANLRYFGGIIAPGFECHISQARHNNTPPLAGLQVYLLYKHFLPLSRLMFCFDFVVF